MNLIISEECIFVKPFKMLFCDANQDAERCCGLLFSIDFRNEYYGVG